MKYIFCLLITLCFNFGFAQIPNGYYDTATGSGYALKTQLYNIINNQNDQGYNAMDNFFLSNDLDQYYENDNTILDIYSEHPMGADPYNFNPQVDECGNYTGEGDCYSKEHVIPRSVFNDANPMDGDAHNLLPVDGRVNGFRGSFPMGRVDYNNLASQNGISNPTQNGSKLGDNLNSGYSSGYSGTVFEPIDEFKGDIARIYFYFATRYQNQISNWSAFAMFNGSSDQVFETAFLNILLEWHSIDPVSQKEVDRNNAIYDHQGNRNPFIDTPSYVTAIWNPQQDNQNPSVPTNLVASNPTATSVSLNWTAATDNVGVSSYDIYVNNSYNSSTSSTSTTVTSLSPETNYCFTIIAKDNANNSSVPSNEDCATTLSGSTNTVDLFFSEYMEGSGTNKALEIANFTGASVNLSTYQIKLSLNGNTNWNYIYSFPTNTSINNGEVFVVANGGAVVCQSVFDNLNNDITSFNGKDGDAIALYKNNNLIDIIGVLGDDQDFAKDVTLVRNDNIASGSTAYNANEWTSYPQNTCSNLGSHTQTLSAINIEPKHIKIYPNPINGALLFVDVQNQTQIEIFDLTGKPILKTTVDSQQSAVDISTLSSGMYIMHLQNTHGQYTRKIVKY